jgi:hypothetical protein
MRREYHDPARHVQSLPPLALAVVVWERRQGLLRKPEEALMWLCAFLMFLALLTGFGAGLHVGMD